MFIFSTSAAEAIFSPDLINNKLIRKALKQFWLLPRTAHDGFHLPSPQKNEIKSSFRSFIN